MNGEIGNQAADTAAPPAKPRRRWLRFSLRTLLLLVTIFGVWLGVKLNAARRQHKAVEIITAAGGEVGFDYELGTPPSFSRRSIWKNPNATPPGPAWLRKTFGDDFFTNAVSLVVSGNGNSALQIEQLDQLPTVEYISFFATTVPVEELAKLERLPHLRCLMFCPTDDPTLICVSKLKQLKELNAQYANKVTDKGLEALGTLTGLEHLTLHFPTVTDAGLKPLRKLTNLKYLDLKLGGEQISDAALEELGTLTSLRYLTLNCPHITDAGVGHLQNLPNLEELDLSFTAITDAGLQSLAQLKSLKELQLDDTKVTPAGIKNLQKSLPKTTFSGP